MSTISSDWLVTKEKQLIAGDPIWRIYRIIDINKPDKIGNREYREGMYMEERNAYFAAELLNRQHRSSRNN